MNTTAELKLDRPLKWRWRHKKLYTEFVTSFGIVVGMAPAIVAFIGLHIWRQHFAMSTPALIIFMVAAYTMFVWGGLLGAIAAYARLCMDKFYFPEPPDARP